MPACRSSRKSCALRGERGVQTLAFGVKAFQHGHATGHALNPVGLVHGRRVGSRLRDHRATILFTAQCSVLGFALDQLRY
jgi:hypothetical protein